MTFREIEFGSEDFQQECELRHKLLRVPIGLSLYDEDIGLEKKHLHFGQFDESGNLAACVIAVPYSPTEARIRQMVVSHEHQGKGQGRRLLHCLEDHLMRRGFKRLCLNARMTAVGFYEKMGYAKAGPEFLEVGIPHVRMEKSLPQAI